MNEHQETWNADMRAALSGLIVEESLFSALNDSVLDTNAKHGYWSDKAKQDRVAQAFAYADLCERERYLRWRLEGLLILRGKPMSSKLIERLEHWFTEFTYSTRFGHSTNLTALGLYVNVAELMLERAREKLFSLSALGEEIGNDLRV